MFGWELPPFHSGGLGVACLGLAKALARRGIDLTFVLPEKRDVNISSFKIRFADESKEAEGDIPVFSAYTTSTRYRTADLFDLRKRKIAGYCIENLFDRVKHYAFFAQRIAREENFDLIHAHDWLSFPAAITAKKISNKPFLVHIHATEFDRGGGNNINPEVYQIEYEGMQLADRVITVSDFTKSIVLYKYSVSPDKVLAVHNGIDYENIGLGFEKKHKDIADAVWKLKEAGNKIVLFVGRITLQKGPDYLLSAAKKVLEYNSKVIFIIIGDGDMKEQIINQAAYMGIADKFLFTGFMDQESIYAIYKAADLFVMPSVSEPFGIVPLESLAFGTPVLISKQSGVSEILVNALKTDFWDIDDMAQKILAVLKYPPLKSTLSKNGSCEVKKYTWDRAAHRCVEIYNQVLSFA